jgi:hypothetical protein
MLLQSFGWWLPFTSEVRSIGFGSWYSLIFDWEYLTLILYSMIIQVVGLSPLFRLCCFLFCSSLLISLVGTTRLTCDIIVNLYQCLLLNSILILGRTYTIIVYPTAFEIWLPITSFLGLYTSNIYSKIIFTICINKFMS